MPFSPIHEPTAPAPTVATTNKMRQAINILPRKAYTTIQARKSPTFRDLLRTPVLKTLLLTFLFGLAVVESGNARKEIESLRAAYDAKFRIIGEVTQKIRNKEPVNVTQELNIANSMTRNKYKSVTDLEVDDQFEAFLQSFEETETSNETLDSPVSEGLPSVSGNTVTSLVIDAKKFL